MTLLLITSYILLLLSPVIKSFPLSLAADSARGGRSNINKADGVQSWTSVLPYSSGAAKVKIDKRQRGNSHEPVMGEPSLLDSAPTLSSGIDVAAATSTATPTSSATSSQGVPLPSYRPAQIPGRSPLRITYLNGGQKDVENLSRSSILVTSSTTQPSIQFSGTPANVAPGSSSSSSSIQVGDDDSPTKRDNLSSYNKTVTSRKKEFRRLGLVALVTGSATLGVFLVALILWLVFVRRPRWLAQYIYLGQKTHEPQNKMNRSLSLRRFQGHFRPPMSETHKYSGDEIGGLESEYTRSR